MWPSTHRIDKKTTCELDYYDMKVYIHGFYESNLEHVLLPLSGYPSIYWLVVPDSADHGREVLTEVLLKIIFNFCVQVYIYSKQRKLMTVLYLIY